MRALLEAESDISVVGDAPDGRIAVEKIRELKPDVVVMDISMPGLNGIEAAQQISAELPDVRVVMLSMHSTSEHVFRALKAGASGYLLKESAGKEVVAAVRSVVNGRRFLSEKITDVMIDDIVRGDHPDRSPLERLSAREREVLQLVVEGRSTQEAADILFLSPKSIETYRSRIMQKLGVRDMTSLVKFAIQHGIIGIT